jgi:hydroxymethylglutaryl-CoA reductase (NADPH)
MSNEALSVTPAAPLPLPLLGDAPGAPAAPAKVPRDAARDYTEAMAARRRAFAEELSGASLSHVARYSFDPQVLPGNIENFLGVAQVPIGLAGPLLVEGEHVHGAVYVPLATTEGTLVASYNRGMRLLAECGGVKATVVETAMQRAPAFVLRDAQEAREFGAWVERNLDAIREVAESTTRSGKLTGIGQYQVGPVRYLRFNYTAGDAAGQNLTGKATWAACEWIKERWPGSPGYMLSGGIDTDKKHSHVNQLLTRGKRVVAEAVLRKDRVRAILGVDTADIFRARQVALAGAFLAGAANNSVHPANGLAALFIATGQDAANVAESHSAITYTQLLENGDYYWSITLTSLIVATYGGGTGLPTQRQCLELMGCYGAGKVDRLAEICAAVVLAGETSLAGAVLHGDWVPSHDRLGRCRR